MESDAELLQRIRSGATDEYAEIVRRHQQRVFSILGRYERDHQRVEDLAQETFLKAWRALGQFDGRAPFEHWLARIATHTALDHLRREKKHRATLGLDELGEDALDWLRHPDEKDGLPAREAAEILHRALAQLSPADRIVITMQELEGRSIKEIAARTGFSSLAVRVRAVRARTRLKRVLNQFSSL